MSNYFTNKIISHRLKISNKHVLQLNITHVCFFIVRSHQRQKVKVFEI
jgi:hypothetical protein